MAYVPNPYASELDIVYTTLDTANGNMYAQLDVGGITGKRLASINTITRVVEGVYMVGGAFFIAAVPPIYRFNHGNFFIQFDSTDINLNLGYLEISRMAGAGDILMIIEQN